MSKYFQLFALEHACPFPHKLSDADKIEWNGHLSETQPTEKVRNLTADFCNSQEAQDIKSYCLIHVTKIVSRK